MGGQLLEAATAVGAAMGGAAALGGAGYGIGKALDALSPAPPRGYTRPAPTTDQARPPRP